MDQVAQDTLTDILCIYNIYDRIAVQISHNLQLEGDPCRVLNSKCVILSAKLHKFPNKPLDHEFLAE